MTFPTCPAFDTLIASIGAAIVADRTLGGLCDWVEAEAPHPMDLLVVGASSLKAAVIPVVLHYSTADPLGCPVAQGAGFAVQQRNVMPRFKIADIAGEATLVPGDDILTCGFACKPEPIGG